MYIFNKARQQNYNCSKSTTEIQGKDVKHVQWKQPFWSTWHSRDIPDISDILKTVVFENNSSSWQVGNFFIFSRKFISCLLFRNSRREVFCKEPVVKSSAKFKGKDLCQSLFLIKLELAELFRKTFNSSEFFISIPPSP